MCVTCVQRKSIDNIKILFVYMLLGAVHKVRHARGGGVREGVTVCDRGRGKEHVTFHL